MSAQCDVTARRAAGAPLGFFERYLTLWVASPRIGAALR